ncbi:MAG: AmmeMemoRadiSam system radical SAM enzyme [Candidatus Omnitrophica bacterium]|nr:AmmeMemoRadiSam system radical SAM enzyme [Candidatus Omnitrophota bacterium]
MKRKAMLWKNLEDNKVLCELCAHQCKIPEDGFGFCGMRQNLKGELYTYAYGRVIANHVDPIEKKPFYHFLPGTHAYSIATIGCNFHCSFCQNWTISQISARDGDVGGAKLLPDQIVDEALRNNCKSISYTYTEPTIFFEYAHETSRLAKEKGLYNTFVTNGFMTEKAIKEISPYLDAANVDLKFFSEESYQKVCKGKLQPVLDSIVNMKKEGIWVEVTTLIIPGENDSEKEIRDIARFIAGVGKEIPWHISRFHPDYKYTKADFTPIAALEKALSIGKEEGLKYIYIGNIYTTEETVCPGCGSVLIERSGFKISPPKGFSGGKCTSCGTIIEGVWE